MKNINDEERFIFARMAEGDKEAFRFFFEKYYADLCNFVNIYLNDPAMAEDIIQDVYVYFWSQKEEIHIETSIKSYLLKASKNKSLNYLRNEKNRLAIHEKLANESATSCEIPEEREDDFRKQAILEKAVASLPEKCREIYILCKEKKLTYKEISNELGISTKTVENQMGIALKKLREFLKPYYDDLFILFLMVVVC
ncbi:RNA polymerase sigma-70 factor [Anaerorudis cellulosivorans]|uniref:RNA polymerase sigma-70 factor n=1 Tax=Anaerorudis cellulosivorans TaxID=3397862 RepID=UPI0022212099|nr:RNA polymerase sigma-70 factor [Seramator thermalis]MCW1735453.1 RNA polymerase sigma-70 factor [Seramator thermalis]